MCKKIYLRVIENCFDCPNEGLKINKKENIKIFCEKSKNKKTPKKGIPKWCPLFGITWGEMKGV